MNQRLLVRADAGVGSGAGHAMRCLALAEESLRMGAVVEWAAVELPDWISSRLEEVGIRAHRMMATEVGSAEDAAATGELARRLEADWVVVDGYRFGPEYFAAVKTAAALRLLALSDFRDPVGRVADLVLNQNVGAVPGDYPGYAGERERLLLGPGFALLRSEFRELGEWKRSFPQVAENVLVTMGGSDPDNATEAVLRSIAEAGRAFKGKVLLGGSNSHQGSVEAFIRESGLDFECVRNARNVPALMQAADLIVTAGGSTVWEACFLGLPGAVGVIAENQEGNAERLDAAGALRNVGRFAEDRGAGVGGLLANLADDVEGRREMSAHGRRLVDGYGALRAVYSMNDGRLSLDVAADEDMNLVWELANEVGVRAMSFELERIPWQDHVQWYSSRLNDDQCCFWIARDVAGDFVGVVRFEGDGEEAVISVSLTAEFRGRGYGGLLVWSACRRYAKEFPGRAVLAWIRPENRASVRIFEKAGFEKVSEECLKGHAALLYRSQNFC